MSGINIDTKKIMEMLENHADKIVLVIIAILCLFLLWSFVIGNPYAVKYNGVKYTPSSIDKNVNRMAGHIEDKLKEKAPIKVYGQNQTGVFDNMLAASVKVDLGIAPIIQPGEGKAIAREKRTYSKPDIPAVTDISAAPFKTVVHIPTETVNMAMPYASVKTELGDIDLISVQVSFDVQALYENFKRTFSGLRVMPPAWRDEALARPVFAAVQLERQTRLADGNWSQWQKVPRTKIDQRREMFDIPEKISQVTLGGIELLISQYDKPETQKGLLQPDPYDFAASNVQWLPPAFREEVLRIREKEDKDQKKEERGLTKPTASRTRGRDMQDEEGYGENMVVDENPRGRRAAMAARDRAAIAARDKTVDQVFDDFAYAVIPEDVDFEKITEPLLVWAHDDTVQPKNTYRYRMKLGVFNPTAGKGWFAAKDAEFRDDVVLWGEYSSITEPISIEPMLYLFPTALERNSNNVLMDIAKFYQGNWRTHSFSVGVGQTIGESVEITSKDKPGTRRPGERPRPLAAGENAQVVDFSSGATLIDIVTSPSLSAAGSAAIKPYKQVFLTENGKDIDRLPVTKAKWPRDLQILYDEIKNAEGEPIEISLSRTTGTGVGTGRTGRGRIPTGYEEEFMDYEGGL